MVGDASFSVAYAVGPMRSEDHHAQRDFAAIYHDKFPQECLSFGWVKEEKQHDDCHHRFDLVADGWRHVSDDELDQQQMSYRRLRYLAYGR